MKQKYKLNLQNKSNKLLGLPVTSHTVADNLRECSKTHEAVASPKCTQKSSKQRTFPFCILGKHCSKSFLKYFIYLTKTLNVYNFN